MGPDRAAEPEQAPSLEERAERCQRCDVELIHGTFNLPLLGRARFAYSLRGQAVETEIAALLCISCGAITLTAVDPERIRRAAAADRRTGRR